MLSCINTFATQNQFMEAIAKGILSGLGYGLLIGPLFFFNIRLTLSHGFRHGVALVMGALASDIALVLASWWSANRLAAISNSNMFQDWVGLLCGLLLLGFSISAIFPRKRNFTNSAQGALPISKHRYSLLQGFLINSSNPSNWLFWLSIATVARSEAPPDNPQYAQIFLISAVFSLVTTDLSKVLLAHKIGSRLKPGVPEKIVQIAGVVLSCLSIWVLFRVFQNW
jgi:threonine/homoserine/homoserine lactone efflux protein